MWIWNGLAQYENLLYTWNPPDKILIFTLKLKSKYTAHDCWISKSTAEILKSTLKTKVRFRWLITWLLDWVGFLCYFFVFYVAFGVCLTAGVGSWPPGCRETTQQSSAVVSESGKVWWGEQVNWTAIGTVAVRKKIILRLVSFLVICQTDSGCVENMSYVVIEIKWNEEAASENSTHLSE